MDIRLTLTIEEVQTIINILGEMPTKTSIFPLLMKIVDQANDQAKNTDEQSNTK